jgi:glycine betaine/proline transport system substrate-binding protein
LNAGYGCNATTVAGDTVPMITAMIEKGQPDISPELTPSLLGEFDTMGVAEGRISQIGTAISDGSVSGWHIPDYVAAANPDIKTVADAISVLLTPAANTRINTSPAAGTGRGISVR